MKKWTLVLLIFSSSLVAEPFREDPERLFDMRKAMTSMSTIKIEHARSLSDLAGIAMEGRNTTIQFRDLDTTG